MIDARTLRTIRYLRPSQLAWRLRYALQRKLFPSLPSETTGYRLRGVESPQEIQGASSGPGAGLSARAELRPPSEFQHRREELKRGELTLLNLTKPVQLDHPANMDFSPNHDRLWQVRFHGHEWLVDLVNPSGIVSESSFDIIRRTIEGWLNDFAPLTGRRDGLAWNSYVIATRIRSWCLVWEALSVEQRSDLHETLAQQLARQADFLSRNIEWDLRANHLLRDALGLAFACKFLAGPDVTKWERQTMQLVDSQVDEQILEDGSHFERSPMYHADVMGDLLQIGLLFADHPPFAEKLTSKLEEMANFLHWSLHPDHRICLFNDAAFNGMPSSRWLLESINTASHDEKHESSVCRLFSQAGLLIAKNEDWHLFFDVGPVGVDYQPGHAHADNLTLEASYKGRRLIVDPGTFAYDRNSNRAYDRSTAAHNTVTVDETDSSEVWDIFRVGRRAQTDVEHVDTTGQRISVIASHDGYRHLSGSPCHRRELECESTAQFSIIDRVEGHGTHRLEAGLLFDPNWSIQENGDNRWVLQQETVRLQLDAVSEDGHFSLVKRHYHPEYGLELETNRLSWNADTSLPAEVRFEFSPLHS